MSSIAKNKSRIVQNNFDDENLEFISKPFENNNSHKYQEYTLVQINSPCKVTPSVSSMKKTVKSLLD